MATPAAPDNKPAVLDDFDDDFEEFPAEDWKTQEEDFPVWEDNWDDDNVDEDFSQSLKNELAKQTICSYNLNKGKKE